MTPIIKSENLCLWYGENQALKNINIEIPSKSITALIGPSGCGKSTFLKTLNRMNDLLPNVKITGKVEYDNKNIFDNDVDVNDLRKNVGMVFQKPNPFPMSIYDNIAYGPRTHGITNRVQLNEIVEEALKSAAIWDEVKDRLKKSALGLSGGQQQRLCIARALAVKPQVLLMDEPTSALDPISTSKIEELTRISAPKIILQEGLVDMRSRFDENLSLLNKEMIEMGAACERIIALSAKALLDGDIKEAANAKAQGAAIDRMERDIESICLKLLLQQQPVASDLRMISAALKMITDMERIGDQAEDIAEIIVFLNGRTGEECHGIRKMAETVIKMVTDSIDAYVHKDLTLARAVYAHDDLVDEDFVKIKKSLIKMIADNTADGEYALDILMIAKYFERIGDHAVNIAEWVEFSVTGIHNNNTGGKQA